MLRRQRRQISLRLNSWNVERARTAVLAHHDEASRRRLRLKVDANGKCTATRKSSTRGSIPPRLKGRFREADGGVVFEGVIREAHSSVFVPRCFAGLTVFFAAVAVILVIVGNPTPGSYVCGVSAVLFGLVARGIARLREESFSSECRRLGELLIPLMPGAKPFDPAS
jgi:hypothetical protein